MLILFQLIQLILEVLLWLIIADAVLSYFPSMSRHPLVLTLRRITAPILAPFRKIFPPRRFGDAYIDFSPLIALLLIMVLQMMLASVLLPPTIGRRPI